MSNVNVSVSALTGPGGAGIPAGNCTLYREQYVSVWPGSVNWNGSNQPAGAGIYPDGLIPFVDPATGASLYNSSAQLRAVPFNLAAGTNQPIWVDVLVPTSVPGGTYTGTYTVTTSQGTASGSVSLTVWNFALPTAPALKSSFAYWTAGNLNADEELLRNRLMPVRSNITDQPALMGMGLSTTSLGYASGARSGYCYMAPSPSVSTFKSAAAAQTPGLSLYNYSADEIGNCSNLFPTVQQWACNLHQAGVNNLVTIVPTPALYSDGCSSRSAVDIWAVLPVMYDLTPANVNYVIAKGDQVWSYNTLVQDAYSPKWEIDFSPVNFRIQPGFINQVLGLTGLLYWRVDLWRNANPWTNVDNTGYFSTNDYPGEGMLVYPGVQVGIAGVAPSMRLKWLRDGVDDYDYIQLLKNAGYGSWALDLTRTIASNWTIWTKDIASLESVRQQLGQKLDQLGGVTSGAVGSEQLSPSSGSASNQWFQLTYSDASGGNNLGGGGVLFNSEISGSKACWAYYDRSRNTIALADNTGSTWASMAATGGGLLSNSQCSIRGASAAVFGTNLQVSLSVSFNSSFAGTKNIYLYSIRSTGSASSYQQLGTWLVP